MIDVYMTPERIAASTAAVVGLIRAVIGYVVRNPDKLRHLAAIAR